MKSGRPQAKIDTNDLIDRLCRGESHVAICKALRICRRTLGDRVTKLRAAGRIKEVGLRMLYERTA